MPDSFPHTTVLATQREDDGAKVLKQYRWRVELFDGRPRVVGEHRVFAGPEDDVPWSKLHNPDRMAQLLALTPEVFDG